MSHGIYSLQDTKHNWCNKGEESVKRRYEGQQVSSSCVLRQILTAQPAASPKTSQSLT